MSRTKPSQPPGRVRLAVWVLCGLVWSACGSEDTDPQIESAGAAPTTQSTLDQPVEEPSSGVEDPALGDNDPAPTSGAVTTNTVAAETTAAEEVDTDVTTTVAVVTDEDTVATTTAAPTTQPPTTTGAITTTSTAAPTTTTTEAHDRPGAPDFTLELGNGGTFTLSAEPRPVYLVFWAEW